MTIIFLQLKEKLKLMMYDKNMHYQPTTCFIILNLIKELEAEFECKSLAEAGYF